MNLLTYDFKTNWPETTDPALLELATERGFTNNYGEQKAWIGLFDSLFFGGGKLAWKESISKEERAPLMSYFRQYMQGFDSSHGDKTAICAMLLSEVVDLEKVEV